jgi:ribonuclease P protein component
MSGDLEYSRAGFIAGKLIGNAVKRNRVKRQLRAILSNRIPNILIHSDMLVIARGPIKDATYDEIKSAIYQLLLKANLIDQDDSDARRPTN